MSRAGFSSPTSCSSEPVHSLEENYVVNSLGTSEGVSTTLRGRSFPSAEMNSRGRILLAEPAAEAASSREAHSEDFSYEDFEVQALDSPERIPHNPAGDGSDGGAGNAIAREETLYEPSEVS